MERTTNFKVLGAIVVALALAGQTAPAARPAADKPNFVFLLIDDMGWADSHVSTRSGTAREESAATGGQAWRYVLLINQGWALRHVAL